MWYKVQMVLILSRIKLAKSTSFFKDKNDTLELLKAIVMQKTQCTDYIEKFL